jgi:hypothetical protein
MSDFRKLQSILNEYYGQYMDFPNNKYQPNDNGTGDGKKNTYRRPVPTTSPDKPSYAWSPLGTAPIEAEEEITGTIDKRKVIAMIDKAIEEAQQQGMDYCVYALGKLRKEIIG